MRHTENLYLNLYLCIDISKTKFFKKYTLQIMQLIRAAPPPSNKYAIKEKWPLCVALDHGKLKVEVKIVHIKYYNGYITAMSE